MYGGNVTINILVKICKKEMVAFLAITIENVSLQGVEKVNYCKAKP